MDDLEKLLERLIVAQVEFVVIGGFAVAACGAPLVTQDLDVCCPLDLPNLTRIDAALASTNPGLRDRVQHVAFVGAKFPGGLKNLYLKTTLGAVVFLGEVPDWGNYQRAMEHSIEIETDAGTCRIIDIDALIEIKEKVGRSRDREAVILLRAIKEKQGG